ncbi:MAG: phenylalanine--tRNA ligase subunit beta [Candidatus Methanomethylicia archaeon]
MPTVTFNKKMLFSLMKNIDEPLLLGIIKNFKGEVKNLSKDEITVEFEPDRPDLFSIFGFSRAIKSYIAASPCPHEIIKKEISYSGIVVEIIQAKLRPFIACAVVRDVNLNYDMIKDLMNFQEMLHLTIGRDRRKVAIGIHDLDKIAPPILYTEVSPKSKMMPLGMYEELSLEEILKKHEKGIKYAHLIDSQSYPVYIDKIGIFSFPPIINSNRTRVTTNTKNLFIELTGTDKRSVEQTLNVILADFIDMGSIIESVQIKEDNLTMFSPDLHPRRIIVDLTSINDLLGLNLQIGAVANLLRRMMYDAKIVSDNILEVLVPPYRVDILHKVDIIEDIAIAYGYENLKPELPTIATIGKESEMERREAKIREVFIGLGFQEVLTFTLTSERKQVYLMNLANVELLKIENPISDEYCVYRRWIIPNLLNFLSFNRHRKYPQKIFEIGYVSYPINGSIIVGRNVSAAIAGSNISFADIKAVHEILSKLLSLNTKLIRKDHPSFIQGRSAAIMLSDCEIGIIGEIHPSVLNNFNITVPVVTLEFTHYYPKYCNSVIL